MLAGVALALAGCDQLVNRLTDRSEASSSPSADHSGDSVKVKEAHDLPKERDGMVLVPAGMFWMGCTKEMDKLCRPGLEGPRHEVWLDSYYIDRTEVTVEAYRACVDAKLCPTPNPATGSSQNCNWGVEGRDKHPINCVSQQMAIQFCEAVGKKLPTEAQWDKAARGPEGWTYPWGNEPTAACPRAHLTSDDESLPIDQAPGCGTDRTAEVGTYPDDKSPYGAMDMLGNVEEYVLDAFTHEEYDPGRNRNPEPIQHEPGDSLRRIVVRGDSLVGFRKARLTHKSGASDISGDYGRGFRCVTIGTDPPQPKLDIKSSSESK